MANKKLNKTHSNKNNKNLTEFINFLFLYNKLISNLQKSINKSKSGKILNF